jgi:hypothetical protein
MKKLFLISAMLFLTLTSFSQDLKFGDLKRDATSKVAFTSYEANDGTFYFVGDILTTSTGEKIEITGFEISGNEKTGYEVLVKTKKLILKFEAALKNGTVLSFDAVMKNNSK